ncbi:MAG: rod shape-determining protein MreC [Leptolyngbyaceae bacterium]|nr:rod shape-determining protein MreC [Leptolyngbyaceae bacterium]
MLELRRWWERYSLRVGLSALAIATAWSVRQLSGAPVLEAYRWISQPFQPGVSQPDILDSAAYLEMQKRLVELESQNRQLQEMLGYAAAQSIEGITAPIIGRSADQWWQQVTLGRGSNDGIHQNDIVTGTGGLVGRVSDVTANTSRVLLISDPASQIGVTISRSRSTGFLRGQAENTAVMVLFDKSPDIRPGDVVTTSTFSQVLPAGIPVGTVTEIDFNADPSPEATVQMSAPISALEWVIVYPNSKDPDDFLEGN